MSNIIYVNPPKKSSLGFFEDHKDKFKASVNRLQKIIDNPNKCFDQKLEAKMVKAIFEFDDIEFERTIKLLDRTRKIGIKTVG